MFQLLYVRFPVRQALMIKVFWQVNLLDVVWIGSTELNVCCIQQMYLSNYRGNALESILSIFAEIESGLTWALCVSRAFCVLLYK